MENTKCKAVIKTGVKQGLRCVYNAKFNGYCGVHKGLAEEEVPTVPLPVVHYAPVYTEPSLTETRILHQSFAEDVLGPRTLVIRDSVAPLEKLPMYKGCMEKESPLLITMQAIY